jgi:putative membrane protein
MKRLTMGAVVLCCAGVVGAAGAQSCNMPGMSGGMTGDKGVVTEASKSDYTEITFSQLALQKATNPKVKAYAQKMITDHNQLEAEMKPVADKLGVTPVTSLDAKHQQLYDQLNAMSGADFDKTYMQDMDQDHHMALDTLKSAEPTIQDKQLKPIAKKAVKVVAMHTEMADKMVKSMGGTPASGM